MTQCKCIDTQQAAELIREGAAVTDIRDAQSYAQGHIQGASNLNNENLHQFITDADMDKPLLVCCYHGISSQSAAQFLIEQGFDDVYSINGGFEAWRVEQPELCDTP
ncbi:thiosulfate sulfurtransferase GlpE [uncultured Neptuniibacter sp.]|uniref:thiosulfate sulfurtransferase GlpE n=1 Tax=uncultured Neptuniibacter sp. TaxID=502143 RepID=UPI00260FC92F|nr:thiosulfate sulfurtransferase GlpE [uncultured Neptuniibacter sp.]